MIFESIFLESHFIIDSHYYIGLEKMNIINRYKQEVNKSIVSLREEGVFTEQEAKQSRENLEG
jgi:hypothetical protein